MRPNLLEALRAMTEGELYAALYQDPLTGVLNRRAFTGALGEARAVALAPLAGAVLAHAAIPGRHVHADVVEAAPEAEIGVGVRVGRRAERARAGRRWLPPGFGTVAPGRLDRLR